MSRSKFTRREFLAVAAQSGAAASLSGRLCAKPSWGSSRKSKEVAGSLFDLPPKLGPVYEGEHLEHIAFPLGGIGTGSIALSGSAELTEWQIWNRVYKPARIGQTFFALEGKVGSQSFTRVLQTKAVAGMEHLTPMKSLQFRGEFPIAWVSFQDDIPLEVTLEALSPMIPLEPEKSAFPAAIFTWTLKNRGTQPVSGFLTASLQNAVGHNGYAVVSGHTYVGYGKNRVKEAKRKNRTHLFFEAAQGRIGGFESATTIVTQCPYVWQTLETAENTHLHYNSSWKNGPIPLSASVLQEGSTVIWMDQMDAKSRKDPLALMPLAKAVEGGARLVLGGGEGSLAQYLLNLPVAPDSSLVLADFDSEEYAPGWRVEGAAFGKGPAAGTFPGQQPVTGAAGLRMVNSYNSDDTLQGKLISPEFTLVKPCLQFLVGGGQSQETEIRLLVDGQIALRASGLNTEHLRREAWDVSKYLGKKAHLEIVDESSTGWGHINVDDIRLSDHQGIHLSPEEAALLRRLLPFQVQGIQTDGPVYSAHAQRHPFFDRVPASVFHGMKLGVMEGLERMEGAEILPGSGAASPLGILGSVGKGKVLFLNLPLGEVRTEVMEKLLGQATAFLCDGRYRERTGWPAESPFYGSMALGCLDAGAETLPAWTQSATFDDFLAGKPVQQPGRHSPSKRGESFAGAIRLPYNLAPGEEVRKTFAITWHFPNHYINPIYTPDQNVGNEYNRRFRNASDVFESIARNREELLGLTHQFHDSFYRSTLPIELLDCVTSQASILKSQTSMWLEDGTFAGWEGVSVENGCCPMNCTHVYNYAQAMACLYPSLEREVRSKDLGIQLTEEGIIHHRLTLPLSAPRASGEALDGQLGTLLKLCREHRRSPDNKFLQAHWESAKKAMQFVFRSHDPHGEGVIRDRQFNTYDDAVYGLNSFIGTLYLAALRAMESMAGIMGDSALAADCWSRFARGYATIARECWDGEYFMQPADLEAIEGRNYGKGCLTDQVVGQWWSHILGLGYILPENQIRGALESVLKYNWRERMEGHKQEPRTYAAPDDSGLLACTWPKGGRPKVPILYCDEVWTGLEYQVAGHLLFEGYVEKCLDIVAKARKRSDGRLRKGTHPSGVGNPWNEIECGDHYARAMSSYALLLAAQGQVYDGPRGILGFHPAVSPDQHMSFFTTAQGWGRFEQLREGKRQSHSITLSYGTLQVTRLSFSVPDQAQSAPHVAVSKGDSPLASSPSLDKGKIHIDFSKPLQLLPNERLLVEVELS